MFFPYRTDSPVYHFPFATIGMIAANIAVHFLADPEALDPYLNQWGRGLRPWQWITGCFIHADLIHLLGNMLFLWVFGLVVEGKLGWWKFLLVFLGIGAGESAVEQVIFLGAEEGYSYGASSIVYGLIGVSLMWAPKNLVSILLFFPPYVRTFQWSIQGFSYLYIGIDIAFTLFWGSVGVVASELLHILGAAIGLPIGIVMLRKGWVDCEGWDWFSVRKGTHLSGLRVASRRDPAEDDDLLLPDEDREFALEQIREAIGEKNGLQALALHRESAADGRWLLDEPELRKIALLLAKDGAWEEAAPLLEEHRRRFPGGDPLVALRLAEHWVVRGSRPTRAKELLEHLDAGRLAPAAAVHREKLIRLCQERIDAGVFELFD